jgi:hypothetical protein
MWLLTMRYGPGPFQPPTAEESCPFTLKPERWLSMISVAALLSATPRLSCPPEAAWM